MPKEEKNTPVQREMERIIVKYWKDCDHLQRLVVKEQLLVERIAQLHREMEILNELPGVRSAHGAVSGGVRCRRDWDLSDVMVMHETNIKRFVEELVVRHRNLSQIRWRIFGLKAFIAPIQVLMDKLSDEEKQLTELRYVYRYSHYQIGYRLNCSEFRVRELKQRILNQFAEWLDKKDHRKANATKGGKCGKLVS